MSSDAFSTRVVILRIRSCVFILVVTLGVLWIGLLALEAYLRGGYHTAEESVAVVTLIIVNCISSISIPIFSLLDFSESSEGSRWFTHIRFELAFIGVQFLLQTTAALLFTILSPNFRCDDPGGNGDAEGECRLLNVYISIATWLMPLILISFMIYFGTVCLRTARRFPTLWRTAVRFCPWDDRPMSAGPNMLEDSRHISIQSRDLENGNGSRTTLSSVSSAQQSRSSRESSQSSTPLMNARNSSSHRTSQPVLSSHRISQPMHLRGPPGRAPPRTVSQLPPSRAIWPPPPSLVPSRPPAYRPMSQPPPAKRASQAPPSRARSNNTPAPRRLPSQTPPTRMPSRSLPLRPAMTNIQSPSMLVANASGPPRGRVSSSTPNGLKKSVTLDNYVEGWKRDRRDLTMHPPWLG